MRSGRKLRPVFVSLAALVFQSLIVSSAAAEPRVVIVGGSASEADITANDAVVHHASGFVFPRQIGDMPLRKVIVYGPADVSVDYTLNGGGNGDAWITLFVYPSTQDLTSEANDIEAAIKDKLHPSRIEAPGELPTKASDGRSGWYRGHLDQVQLTTTYIVVRRGDWFIEARASIPDKAGPAGVERTLKALAAVPWDWNESLAARPVGT